MALLDWLGLGGWKEEIQEVALDGVEAIGAVYDYEDVQIVKNPSHTLLIKEYMKKDIGEMQSIIQNMDGEIVIREGIRPRKRKPAAKVELWIPEEYHGCLRIATNSGEIQCLEKLYYQEFEARTISGMIELIMVTADEIEVVSQSGDITLGILDGRDIVMYSEQGRITVAECRGAGSYHAGGKAPGIDYNQIGAAMKNGSRHTRLHLNIPEEFLDNNKK